MTVTRVALLSWLCAGLVTAAARPAAADNGRFVLLVQGPSGDEQISAQHRTWVDSLAALLRNKFNYDAAHLTVLAEKPAAGEQPATADAVSATLARLAASVGPTDQLVIVLIGLGSGQGPEAKFNLVGRDLTVVEWGELLKPVRGRLALVDTSSDSLPFLIGLSAPGRVIITATSRAAQNYATTFAEAFIQAFLTDLADLDKNTRISLLEAFTFASRIVKQGYEQKGTMANESAAIDDDGDGKGREATATGPDGSFAALTYLDTPQAPATSDPDLQRLFTRRNELTDQIDDLRRRKSTMTAEAYDAEFERLTTELAVVSRDIRQKTGG